MSKVLTSLYLKSKLASTIKLGILASVSTSAFIISTGAIAQDAVGANVERIAVTGSRIPRSDLEMASPVTVIDASAISALGATSIDEVLQQLTATGGVMYNPGVNNMSKGGTSINLRGLGAQRTLVLVNNRRMVNSGTGAASTVDLNTIPISMIKRIEVLKDGASAVYGSDAIAGVINIILKDDFEGFELNAQTGISAYGDAEATSIDLTIGGSFNGANLVMGVQYLNRGSASQADRGFSECPFAEGESELVCAGSS